MTRPSFKEPNFRCKVSDPTKVGSKPFGRLVYAESEAEARTFLSQKGLTIHQVKPYDFKEWRKSAEKARNLVIAAVTASRKPSFKSAIWSVLKLHLRDLFKESCAYCEAKFAHVAFGDVEHFRPKARVEGEPNHLGYYWLAYTPENYLPSCQICNQEGKKNYFPIAGLRAFKPSDPLDKEDALLLCPYTDQPLQYLKFSPSKSVKNPGWAMPTKDKGKGEVSINIYGLNRDLLVKARCREQHYARMEFKDALHDEDVDKLGQIIFECVTGERPFASAAIAELEDYCATIKYPSPFV